MYVVVMSGNPQNVGDPTLTILESPDQIWFEDPSLAQKWAKQKRIEYGVPSDDPDNQIMVLQHISG